MFTGTAEELAERRAKAREIAARAAAVLNELEEYADMTVGQVEFTGGRIVKRLSGAWEVR